MRKLVKRAFTLIELLVVIAIIGILSGLIVVSMSGMTTKATIAKAQVFSNSLRNSLMLNLIAEYKLDGDAIDSWGGNAAGTISGATTYASCVQSSCYNFSAGNNYIELADSLKLRLVSGGTISVWIYPRSAGVSNTRGRIIDKSTDENSTNGYNIRLWDNNTIHSYVNYSADTTTVNNVITFNQWHLVTVTFSSSGSKIYINGIDKTSNSGTVLPPNIGGVTRIGNTAYAAQYVFDGYIDEVRIYNAVIPVSEIKEQYYLGVNKLFANSYISQEEYSARIGSIAESK